METSKETKHWRIHYLKNRIEESQREWIHVSAQSEKEALEKAKKQLIESVQSNEIEHFDIVSVERINLPDNNDKS